VAGVTKVEARGDWVEASLQDAHRHLPAVLAAAPRAESVEVHAPTLNDVFLKTTGRALREDAAGEGEGWMESMLRADQGPR
jgi:hypothetical protein